MKYTVLHENLKMTDIYFLKNPTNGENHQDVFIGSLLTGYGHGLTYCGEHNVYEVVPDKYLPAMRNAIEKLDLDPEPVNKNIANLVENIINSIVQEIEKLEKGEDTSEGLSEKVNELWMFFN